MLKNWSSRSTFQRWGWQNVHDNVASARFPLGNVKKLRGSEHFWKMRSTKGARDCSESSISYVIHIISWSHKTVKIWGDRSTCGRWGRQKVHETVVRARFHIKKRKKKLRVSDHLWKMRSAKWSRDCSESAISQKNSVQFKIFRRSALISNNFYSWNIDVVWINKLFYVGLIRQQDLIWFLNLLHPFCITPEK
jgi:hypothetical protein